MRRVVVTGMGIWSCIGTDQKQVADSLRAGRSGIGVDEARKVYGFQSSLTGVVPIPDMKDLLSRRQRTTLSEEAGYAFMASREAFAQAGVTDEYLLQNEVGVLFGNDSTAHATVEAHEKMLERHDSALLGSGLIFQSMNSTVTMNLSTIFHLRGINFTLSGACASGSHAIGIGKMLIQQGLQDMILVGGAQEVNPYAMAAFDALGTFSKRTDSPQQASRPFDSARDGLVPSGGAAALVLEDYEHAKQRGTHILAEVAGYGFSGNGGAISQPDAQGCQIAMKRAMDDAGVQANEIDYVNAHATSTPQGDAEEAMALNTLFAGSRTRVSSTKGMTGHECWMAGASEAVYTILMMQGDFAAPNINLENPDSLVQALHIVCQTETMSIRTALSNSFGFGGTNSALVLKKE